MADSKIILCKEELSCLKKRDKNLREKELSCLKEKIDGKHVAKIRKLVNESQKNIIYSDVNDENDELNTAFDASINPLKGLVVIDAILENVVDNLQ